MKKGQAETVVTADQPIGRKQYEKAVRALQIEQVHRVMGGVDIFGEARARPPVIPKRFEGRRRKRVDGIGPDQLFDVDDVAIAGVFHARAGPQQALCLGTLGGQRLPAPPAEELLVTLVGELGVGDGRPASEAAQDALLSRIRRCLPRVSQSTHRWRCRSG